MNCPDDSYLRHYITIIVTGRKERRILRCLIEKVLKKKRFDLLENVLELECLYLGKVLI